MKKMFFALMTMLTISVQMSAMSYEQARNEALFLTDKMAYELNLTDEQYEAAYEINLDYLMGVTGRADVFGTYWERRNLDLSYILYDWQWNAYIAASYFYRPLYWDAGYWHFGIYSRYPHRDYFYFGRPHFYSTYRGAHAWHRVGGRGYYHGHSSIYRTPGRQHIGMHDRWNRGDYRSDRHSSTRITGPNGSQRRLEQQNRGLNRENRGLNRENRSLNQQNRDLNRQNRSLERENRSLERQNHSLQRGSGSSSMQRGNSGPSRSFGGSRSGSGSTMRSSGSTMRSSGSPVRSSSSHSSISRSAGSHSGGSHSSGVSHGGGSHGGGSRSGGVGGRR